MQTPEVDDVKETVNAELDVAVSVGVVPKFCATGFAKVIDWESFGVTLDEATEAPDKPTLFVAVTVKVYDAPFVSPPIRQLVAGVVGATVATEQFSPVPAVAV